MLKISAGNEEFGLGGKGLLHGFKIAKLNLQGNPRLMQRSHLICAQPSSLTPFFAAQRCHVNLSKYTTNGSRLRNPIK
jgi:hypothetical protein